METTLREAREVRASKEHRCSWCGKRIFEGEEHTVTTLVGDGVYDWRECGRCADEVSSYIAACDPVDGYTGESFMCWLEEERPETYWAWALEDAKVRRSELRRLEGEAPPHELKYETAAASCRVAECENRLDAARRSGLCREMEKALRDAVANADDVVWVGDAETLADRMVRLGLLPESIYDGTEEQAKFIRQSKVERLERRVAELEAELAELRAG